jgi:Asp-tRNA(Asn)/Glu-tRNA(Gln) amidotransferase A subunit family amidase
LCDRIAGYDPADPACYLAPKPSMLQGYLAEVPVEPALVWIDLDYAERFGKDTVEGFEELLDALGSHVERIPAPQSFSALPKVHKIIYDYEIYRCLTTEREQHHDKLSTTAQAAMEHAKQWTDTQYLEALDIRHAANEWFDKFFHDYDAIVTPSATGEAPAIEQGTGDPICCTLWTLCGLPSLTMPLLNGSNNLPIGVQLVGARNHDDRLFRTARWVLQQLREEPQHAT